MQNSVTIVQIQPNLMVGCMTGQQIKKFAQNKFRRKFIFTAEFQNQPHGTLGEKPC